jgi:hypothetical protein
MLARREVTILEGRTTFLILKSVFVFEFSSWLRMRRGISSSGNTASSETIAQVRN